LHTITLNHHHFLTEGSTFIKKVKKTTRIFVLKVNTNVYQHIRAMLQTGHLPLNTNDDHNAMLVDSFSKLTYSHTVMDIFTSWKWGQVDISDVHFQKCICKPLTDPNYAPGSHIICTDGPQCIPRLQF